MGTPINIWKGLKDILSLWMIINIKNHKSVGIGLRDILSLWMRIIARNPNKYLDMAERHPQPLDEDSY